MLQLGRQGQLYVIEEVTYGTTPALAASNAIRHREFLAPFDNKNKRSTNEKRQSPLVNASMRSDTRTTADYTYRGILRPSGTINTIPECDPILKAAMGARRNVTLATTVSAGTGAVGGATLASTTGLAVKDFVLITCPDGRKRLRQILTLPGSNVVTWGPQLPSGQQPADGAAVKACISYRMITGNLPSLSWAYYLKKVDGNAGLLRGVKGAAPNRLSIKFDPNDDVELTLAGMAKEVVAPPAQPGGFTTVGGTPSSIQAGELFIGNTIMKFLGLQFELQNGLWARADEYGETSATEIIRRDEPQLSVRLNTRAEDNEAVLYDLTEAGTNVGVFMQTDFNEGKAQCVYMPTVEFKPPSTDDPMEEVKWDYEGMGLESADGATDALFIAIG